MLLLRHLFFNTSPELCSFPSRCSGTSEGGALASEYWKLLYYMIGVIIKMIFPAHTCLPAGRFFDHATGPPKSPARGDFGLRKWETSLLYDRVYN